MGIFASKNIKKDEQIELAFEIKYNLIIYITSFGALMNHCSINDNTYLKKKDDKYYLYAKKNISIGTEITGNYNNTPKYIKKADNNYKIC